MVKFILVKYGSKEYPDDIKSKVKVQEITANFFNFFKHQKNLQKKDFPDLLSLHTDPRYRGNKNIFIAAELPDEFPNISSKVSNYPKTCMSDLWCDEKWSKEFARFLVKFTEGIERKRIKVIEIHPPINNYYKSLDKFIPIYKVFEEEILKDFPTTIINIENRCNPNPKRKGGKFLLSNTDDIKDLSDLILKNTLKLKIVLDIPQLLSEHQILSGRPGNPLLTEREIKEPLSSLRGITEYISGTHIWGYDINQEWGAHKADFCTYFDGDQDLKKCFIQEICNLFDDDKKRYFVPEIDHPSKVQSVVDDLRKDHLIEFVDPD